jgi:hypothetical protein
VSRIGSRIIERMGLWLRRSARVGIALVALAVLSSGCSKAREAAESASRDFRLRCAREAYADVYRDAAPELRSTVSEAGFAKLMKGLSGKLGAWRSSKEPAWKVFVGTGGRTVTLQYGSQFEKAQATEEFVWRIDSDGRPVLLGYHVNSPALLAN